MVEDGSAEESKSAGDTPIVSSSLHVNHAMLQAMNGDFEQVLTFSAHLCVRALILPCLQAERSCRVALALDPSNQEAARALVYVYLRSGDMPRAAAAIKSIRIQS
jgi:Flp pilus assembly protein TadD